MDGPVSFDGEIWRTIGMHLDYQVSNFGRVYYTRHDTWYAQWEICEFDKYGMAILQEDGDGYLYVDIQGERIKIHRLVAEYFIEGYSVGCLIKFVDGDKHNVRADNLIIFRNNSALRRVVDLKTGREYETISDAAKKLKLNASNISQCCQGKRKSCGGHTFEYLDSDDVCRALETRIVAYRRRTLRVGEVVSKEDLEWEKEQYKNRLYFNSQSEASRVLGIPQSNISRALNTGFDCKGWHFETLDE